LNNDIRPITAAEDKYIVDLRQYIPHINHVYFTNTYQSDTGVEKISRLWMTKLGLKFLKKDAKQVINIKSKKNGKLLLCLIKTPL